MRPILTSTFFHQASNVQHPLEVKLVEGAVAHPVSVVEAAPAEVVAAVEPAVVETAAAPEAEAEAPAAEAEVTEESGEAPAPVLTWDASMVKADLLAIAQQLGLAVTSANTKTEILAALDATK